MKARGGFKLEAAVEAFGLAAGIAGARAVDVGASTGGFTAVLLRHGAASVVAVDVGHDQLAPELRRDARVTLLERADWKKLALSVAPGPFDFFTVDVSFVAARNMLRGLAFRLRAGAEGVVLVKPQFELPDRRRGEHQANADDAEAAWRRRAVDRFRAKAETLGFRLVAYRDSPVPGGEGTVEVLAHLHFEGRPEILPQPGEQRRRRADTNPGESPLARGRGTKGRARDATVASDEDREWFLVVAPGSEDVAAAEARRLLGLDGVTSTKGGISFRGPLAAGMRANLWLRIPTRVILRLGSARAREFGKLRHQLARLPWEAVLGDGAPVRVSATTQRCRLYHTGALEETLRLAIADRTGKETTAGETDDATSALILMRGEADEFLISVDASGERLHRRGYKADTGEAPLRETLGAALLAMAGWQPHEALYDPMCGTGTIPLEAAGTALNIAPGRERSFAFERWPVFEGNLRERWLALRDEAIRAERAALPAPIAGSDRDDVAIAAACANAARLGLKDNIRFFARALEEAAPPEGFENVERGLLLMNPPYGRRIGSARELPRLYAEIGRIARMRFPRWRLAVVMSDVRLASAFRMRVVEKHPLRHGGLAVSLVVFAT